MVGLGLGKINQEQEGCRGGEAFPALTWEGRATSAGWTPERRKVWIASAGSLVDGDRRDRAVGFAGRGIAERGVRPAFVVEAQVGVELGVGITTNPITNPSSEWLVLK